MIQRLTRENDREGECGVVDDVRKRPGSPEKWHLFGTTVLKADGRSRQVVDFIGDASGSPIRRYRPEKTASGAASRERGRIDDRRGR